MDYIVFDLEWNQSDTGEEENAALLSALEKIMGGMV